MINRNKFDWETLNTRKIRIVFYSVRWSGGDYGTKLRIKCNLRIQRKERTLKGELCTNWELLDSFGVNFDDDNVVHDNFYDDPQNERWPAERSWFQKYATVNHRSLYAEKGFILKNGRFERFEPIGITWNDSYCRRMTDAGPLGCFVERDLSVSDDFDNQENNCTGKDSTN